MTRRSLVGAEQRRRWFSRGYEQRRPAVENHRQHRSQQLLATDRRCLSAVRWRVDGRPLEGTGERFEGRRAVGSVGDHLREQVRHVAALAGDVGERVRLDNLLKDMQTTARIGGWEYDVEVVIDAPVEKLTGCLSRIPYEYVGAVTVCPIKEIPA